MNNLDKMTVAELKEKAKQAGIKLTSSAKKSEIISLLEEAAADNAKTADVGTDTEESNMQKTVSNTAEEPKKLLFDVNKTKENVNGILEVLEDGYGFARGANCLDGNSDVYVSPTMIRKYFLRTGDKITGFAVKRENEKFEALVYIKSVNDQRPEVIRNRVRFENLVPVYPDEKL